MFPNILTSLISINLVLGETPGVVSTSCCSQVFLSSSATLSTTQSAALGIYTISSQKIANNPHSVYIKQNKNQDFYLYFRQSDVGGPQGWIVGPQLLEDSYYITTHNSDSMCPGGIYGGFDSDDITRDDTFSIECHSDQVKVDCCSLLKVSSEGALATKQGAVMGDYRKVGDFNGHTWYQGGHTNTSLFYRKSGHGPDGWMVGMDLDENTFIVTTRDKSYCPDVVMMGYDRNQEEGMDTSFRITCQATSSTPKQDPGVPVAPLKPLETLTAEKSINSSARQTLLCSVCFRLLVIVYLIVMHLANQ